MKRYIFLWCLTACLVCTGCDQLPITNDIVEAKKALEVGNTNQAQKILERFLRQSSNSEKRWEAWMLLTSITQKSVQESRWVIEYFEAMLDEFGNDSKKQHYILHQLSDLFEKTNQYDKAIQVLTSLTTNDALPIDEKAKVAKKLGILHVQQKQLNRAEEHITACIQLNASANMTAECSLVLADIFILRENLEKAAEIAQKAFEIPKTDRTLHARTGFMWADILDELGKKSEAKALFEQIKDDYPNKMAVEKRIEILNAPKK